MTFIIVRRPFEEFTTSQLKRTVIVWTRTNVSLVPVILDSAILRRKFLANCGSAIGGCVVAYDQFEVFMILLDKGGEGAGQVFLAVEDRKPDADLWLVCGHIKLRSPAPVRSVAAKGRFHGAVWCKPLSVS